MSYGGRFYKKSSDYKPLGKIVAVLYGKQRANEIFRAAGEELDRLLAQFPDIPKGERNHTDGYIFPRAALYRVMSKELGADEAMRLIDEAVHNQGIRMGKMLRNMTALPFMKGAFLRIFASMAKNMFGEKNGFRQVYYDTAKDTVKFDILDCTYCRYCRLCGCEELIHTFCQSDADCFGSLTGIRFVRESTLDKGDKCDFTLIKEKGKNK